MRRDSFACSAYEALVALRRRRQYHSQYVPSSGWSYTLPWLWYDAPAKQWLEAEDLNTRWAVTSPRRLPCPFKWLSSQLNCASTSVVITIADWLIYGNACIPAVVLWEHCSQIFLISLRRQGFDLALPSGQRAEASSMSICR